MPKSDNNGLVVDGYRIPREVEAKGGDAIAAFLEAEGWTKPEPLELTEAGLMELTKPELMELAASKELSTEGTKADITARILEHAASDGAPVDDDS